MTKIFQMATWPKAGLYWNAQSASTYAHTISDNCKSHKS